MNRFKRRTIRKTDCWIWAYGLGSNRYPIFKQTTGKNVYVRRFFYEMFKGKIPSETIITSDCGNRLCVNPEHLKVTTHKELSNTRTKLSDIKVKQIKSLHRVKSYREIAIMYGVSLTTIARIMKF